MIVWITILCAISFIVYGIILLAIIGKIEKLERIVAGKEKP